MRVAVYNGAGEVVKVILVSQNAQPIDAFSLSTDGLIGSLNDQVDIVDSQGGPIGVWDGTLMSGEPAPNGVYHIKIDNVDLMGVVRSTTQEVMVSRTLYRSTVKIYNEVGEVVRTLYAYVSDPTQTVISGMSLSSEVIRPGGTGAGVATQLTVSLSNGTTIVWDGRSDAGEVVSSGKYFVESHTEDGQGGETLVTRSVVVEGQDGQKAGGVISVVPGTVDMTQGNPMVVFQSTAVGLNLKVRVYTIAGQLVGQAAGSAAGTNFDVTGLASGYYLGVVEASDTQGLVVRRIVGFTVTR